MTVTSIRRVRNECDFNINLGTQVPPLPFKPPGIYWGPWHIFNAFENRDIDFWIPACERPEFPDPTKDNGEVIWVCSIYDLPPRGRILHFFYGIWRYGDQISYSGGAGGFAERPSSGRCIPLNCAVGGNRELTIIGKFENIAGREDAWPTIELRAQ